MKPFLPIPEHTENDVEANCIGWLQSMGWIAERNHVGLFYTKDGRPVPVGRPGACDWRLKRSAEHRIHYLELEVKAPGKKPDKRQLEYMAAMRHAGVVTVSVDGLDRLQAWYAYWRIDGAQRAANF